MIPVIAGPFSKGFPSLSASIRNYSDVFWENFYGQWLTQH